MWQDWIFAVGGLVFASTLLPTIRDPRSEVPRLTSATTGLMLLVFGWAHFTIDLHMAALANGITSAAWAFIYAYRPIRELREEVVEVPQFEVTQEEAEMVLAHREWLAVQRRRRLGEPEPGEAPAEAGCDGCPSQAPSGGPG